MPAGTGHGGPFDPLVLREGVERFPCPAACVHFQDARDRIDLVSGFDHIAISFIVKTAVDGSVKSACHDLGNIALGQKDILRVVVARTFPTDFDLLQVGQDRLVEVR